MARIRMAYIGGGSTRGAGTMASFIHQGENFEGSEVVLIDLDPDRLELIRTLADALAAEERPSAEHGRHVARQIARAAEELERSLAA